jgi:hypothetical protein
MVSLGVLPLAESLMDTELGPGKWMGWHAAETLGGSCRLDTAVRES